MVRNHEVTGSIPVCSTRYITVVGFGRRPFSFSMCGNARVRRYRAAGLLESVKQRKQRFSGVRRHERHAHVHGFTRPSGGVAREG